MITPDTFPRHHKRHATDLIRVALDRKGVIGFIEFHESMTLMEARALIWENVENAPPEFQFVLDDGAPVSARQENTQKVSFFYPCVKIRECRGKKPPGTTGGGPGGGFGSSERLTVRTCSGEEFCVWVSEDYTFAQLRRDASRYWNLPNAEVALTDEEGCLWPEQAKILSVMSVHDINDKRIYLEYKGSTHWKARRQSAMINFPTSKGSSLVRASMAFAGNTVTTPAAGGNPGVSSSVIPNRSFRQVQMMKTLENGLAVLSIDPMATSNEASASAQLPCQTSMPSQTPVNPFEELWHVFTFYCVLGDCREVEFIKAHQFTKLFRDCNLFSGGHLTPTVVNLIYTSETKRDNAYASGKMSYDEFLNALVRIACKIPLTSTAELSSSCSSSLRPERSASCSSIHNSMSTRYLLLHPNDKQHEEAFQRLVLQQILPRASRWNRTMWHQHTALLRKKEIVAFLAKFLDPLLDIFMFYAKSLFANPATGTNELFMNFGDFQKFANDFNLSALQLSSVESAQIFLAACQSSPFHSALRNAVVKQDLPNSTTSGSPNASSNDALLALIQKTISSLEGHVVFAFEEQDVALALDELGGFRGGNSLSLSSSSPSSAMMAPVEFTVVPRLRMGFSAFLDMLGRTGLVALTKLKPMKTIHCLKTVFHHMCRGLTRARVLEILKMHGTASVHATKFFNGSKAFTTKFLDLWRFEGSPDYLMGCSCVLLPAPGQGGGPPGSPPRGSPLPSPTNAATKRTFVSIDEQRTTSSSSIIAAATMPKGREVLGRLVRASFYASSRASGVGGAGGGGGGGGDSTGNLETDPTNPANGGTTSASTTGAPSTAMNVSGPPSPRASSSFFGEKNLLLEDSSLGGASSIGGAGSTGIGANGVLGGGGPDDNSALLLRRRTNVDSSLFESGASDRASSPIAGLGPTATGTGGSDRGGLSNSFAMQTGEDEKAFYERILIKGGVFKKYGQWGNPHRRFVWCSKDFDMVNWRPLNKKNNMTKEGIFVNNIVGVLPGTSSRTKYAFLRHLSDEKAINRCFSLVSEDRRLDLEAESEAARDLWMNAFLFLMRQHRPR